VKISLGEPAARWVDDQIATGRYKDADAYLATLVERDREDAERHAALKAATDEGLASGVSDRTIDEIFEEAREGLALRSHARAGWAEAAALVTSEPETDDEAAWRLG